MRFWRRKKSPTDRQVLETIYNRYYDEFSDFVNAKGKRETKVFVPIDIEEIAQDLDVDRDIIFGRLYYHLDYKYSYTNENGTKVYFFAPKVGNDTHCVNFPYLASILANLRQRDLKFLITQLVAALALIISIVSWFF